MKYTFLHSKNLTRYSRTNRKTQTDAEKLLWFYLRNKQLLDHKFRRQYPIEQYIVDFYCAEKKIAIELDGSQHILQKDYDEKRTAKLQMHGISVLRFWDNDVLTNIEGVLKVIESQLTSS